MIRRRTLVILLDRTINDYWRLQRTDRQLSMPALVFDGDEVYSRTHMAICYKGAQWHTVH